MFECFLRCQWGRKNKDKSQRQHDITICYAKKRLIEKEKWLRLVSMGYLKHTDDPWSAVLYAWIRFCRQCDVLGLTQGSQLPSLGCWLFGFCLGLNLQKQLCIKNHQSQNTNIVLNLNVNPGYQRHRKLRFSLVLNPKSLILEKDCLYLSLTAK